jgi:hypothetical protein
MTAVENELRRASFFSLGSDVFNGPFLSVTSFVVSPIVIRMLPMTPIPNKIVDLLYDKSCEKNGNNHVIDHNDGVSGGFGAAGVFDDADACGDACGDAGADGCDDAVRVCGNAREFSDELLESSSS